MILIDAIYINNSGGKVLLEYFINDSAERITEEIVATFEGRNGDQ